MQLGVNGNIDSSCGEQCLFAVAPAMDKKNLHRKKKHTTIYVEIKSNFKNI